MVTIKPSDNYETLDQLIHSLCKKYGFTVYVDGWARKSYRIFEVDKSSRRQLLLASVESLAVQSGTIAYYDDLALPFCHELGEALETAFGIAEATLEKKQA